MLIIGSGPSRPKLRSYVPAETDGMTAPDPAVYHAPLSPDKDHAVNGKTQTQKPHISQESAEIDALLLAQRARLPIVLVVASDYSAAPFKVPRRIIVLGWFWIDEAWVRENFLFFFPPPPQ